MDGKKHFSGLENCSFHLLMYAFFLPVLCGFVVALSKCISESRAVTESVLAIPIFCAFCLYFYFVPSLVAGCVTIPSMLAPYVFHFGINCVVVCLMLKFAVQQNASFVGSNFYWLIPVGCVFALVLTHKTRREQE